MVYNHVFVLTGAGVSAESGLGTFRDKEGLWARFDIAEVASIDGYRRNPQRVLDFYNMRRANLADARPNAAHLALAQLEAGLAERGGKLTLVTQNVDDLHEQAGSKSVIHMHGELRKIRCDACLWVGPYDADIHVSDGCGACGRVGELRPHIVWFGEVPLEEVPLEMDPIYDALDACDLFVAIGTSGAVYPAAGFVAHARAARKRTLELNLERSDVGDLFHEGRYGPASKVVPEWVGAVLKE